ncbi:MAG: hypothetical protein KF791_09285 [Verrucomicrobiae bacterium]|nr:hypothetical protein [Verrucomicrobiae bacterium]
MSETGDGYLKVEELDPSLREAFGTPLPVLQFVPKVAVPAELPSGSSYSRLRAFDRREVVLACADQTWLWRVESLQSLFRGDRPPPNLGDYPGEYDRPISVLELSVRELAEVVGDLRDDELREVYSALRRRPDGASLGPVHDFVWQASALMLGLQPLSQGEFGEIVGRLARSCRRFSLGPSSRNYSAMLRGLFGKNARA